MPRFHHPTNFIPVSKPTARTPWQDVVDGKTQARHDLWRGELKHGRVVGRLHLQTPTVVGGEHVKESDDANAPVRVLPYEWRGQAAIPGNSLRGVLGSVAETLSQSALRVLEDRRYSVRKAVEGGALSAIGVLKRDKEHQRWVIQALTLPTLRRAGHGFDVPGRWQAAIGARTTVKQALPAYVHGYRRIVVNGEERLDYEPGSFLTDVAPCAFHAADNPEYLYARLLAGSDRVGARIDNGAGLNVRGPVLIGQAMDGHPLTHDEWVAGGEPCDYTRGVLRILDIEERQTDLPLTKRHELFIPVHNSRDLPIDPEAVRRFERLAEERAYESRDESSDRKRLPYTLCGYEDCQLRAGMLLFFDLDPHETENDMPVVSEISISSIWRKLLEGSTHKYFADIDSDLVPWHQGRERLTPAELLLGVVEEDTGDDVPSRSLASRVCVSDALPTNEVRTLPEVTLKVLASPKPPSTALYFHRKNEISSARRTYFPKAELNPDQYAPNGRNFKLHHQPEDIRANPPPWQSRHPAESARLKMRCAPFEAGQDFYFHVDFNNLTVEELDLLLRSLQPGEAFRHKLGLGKSLGLGTVRIDVEAVCFIDRQKRYGRDALQQARYHEAWCDALPQEVATRIEGVYREEAQALRTMAKGATAIRFLQTNPLIDAETLARLLVVGDPAALERNVPVHFPMQGNQREDEREGFKWFEQNDHAGSRGQGQALGLVPTEGTLPTLERN